MEQYERKGKVVNLKCKGCGLTDSIIFDSD